MMSQSVVAQETRLTKADRNGRAISHGKVAWLKTGDGYNWRRQPSVIRACTGRVCCPQGGEDVWQGDSWNTDVNQFRISSPRWAADDDIWCLRSSQCFLRSLTCGYLLCLRYTYCEKCLKFISGVRWWMGNRIGCTLERFQKGKR